MYQYAFELNEDAYIAFYEEYMEQSLVVKKLMWGCRLLFPLIILGAGMRGNEMRYLIMRWIDKLTLRSNKRCKKCGKRLGTIEATYYGFICEHCEKAYYSD